MKRFEYAITAEDSQHHWALWHQDQHGPGETLTKPMKEFGSDLEMLRHMSQEGWELVCPGFLRDKGPRFFFKRRLR